MKTLFFTLFLSLSVMADAQSKTDTIAAFLDGVINFQEVEVNNHNPVSTVGDLAAQQADTVIFLTRNNVNETFNQAKEYNYTLIVVGIHTAALVTSWEDCVQSGAWGVCMPMGKGYVKRGNLEKERGYINNIIGIPDNQNRKVYLFN